MTTPASDGATKTVELGKIGMARLLFVLLHQRFTGTMQLEQPGSAGGTRTVWFDGGMPLFTDWVAPELVLGQVMLSARLITEDQLYAGLETMAESGGLLGQILLGQGAIDAKTLTAGLRRQCQRKLAELFALHSGTVVVKSVRHDHNDQFAKVNVLELVLQGVGRHYDLERVHAEMGEHLTGSFAATAAFSRYRAHFRFRETDAPALDELVRGGSTLDELSRLRGVTLKRAAQLIYALWACQMLRTEANVATTDAPSQGATGAQPQPAAARPPAAPDVSRTTGKHASVSAATSRTTGRQVVVSASQTTGKHAPVSSSSSSVLASRGASEHSGERRARVSAFEIELVEIETKIDKDLHAFDLLGVPVTADKRDVRRAFSELSRKFHPDALQAKGLGHLRERVSKAFAALSEAQMLLSDKDKREELRALIERGDDPRPQAAGDATATARAALESELIAKEADKLLRAGRFERALDRFQDAAKLNPDEDDLQAAIVWCRYNLSDRQKKASRLAERALSEIIETNPNLARAHYFRGLVLKDLGRVQHAIAAFNSAYLADSRLIDAERQARALRRGPGGSKAGKPESSGRFGLRGLFGKK